MVEHLLILGSVIANVGVAVILFALFIGQWLRCNKRTDAVIGLSGVMLLCTGVGCCGIAMLYTLL